MHHWLRPKKNIIPLPYPYYVFTVTVITLIGFFDSIYLAISHYRNYADMGYQSFCAISRAINCDTVSQSPYSIFLGVPVPVWGVMGYGLFLFILAFAWPKSAYRKRAWTLLMLISLTFSLYSIVLAFVSSYYIHSYCIMCILSYAVNLALLFYTWLIRQRFACESFFSAIWLDIRYLLNFAKVTIPGGSAFAVFALGMILVFPPYWQLDPPALSKNTPTGTTEDGHPWIGSEKPELVITEFSDYRCFQCKKMHYFLRRLTETYPDKIQLIHRQFPMDHTINPLVTEPFHAGSSRLSMLAIFAAEQGKFWEMNDYLFNISRETEELDLHDLAEDMDLNFDDMQTVFQDLRLWNVLWADIKDGIQIYELTGTPAFVINGQVSVGQIPADILKPYLK